MTRKEELEILTIHVMGELKQVTESMHGSLIAGNYKGSTIIKSPINSKYLYLTQEFQKLTEELQKP